MAARLRTFAAAHRAALALLGAGAGALGLFWAARHSPAAMAWWVGRVSMPCKRALGALADLAPFSLCEAGATLLILAVLAGLFRRLWRLARRQPAGLGAWALHTAALAVGLYALVCALWGTQYYAPGFAERAGIEAPPVSVQQLEATARYFAAQANACADAVPREGGVFAGKAGSLLADSDGLYDALAGRWPFLAAPERRPKPAFYSRLMSAWGFTGYLCPLLGESTLNTDCPAVFLPVTVAHEFAHQRGVAAEQEANFVGVCAAVTSGKPAYVYSGWLFGFLHLYNALYSADRTLAAQALDGLCPAARADLNANNAYWATWQGPVREVGEHVYDAFLQSYDQELGMRSYGACVDLLVACFPQRPAS